MRPLNLYLWTAILAAWGMLLSVGYWPSYLLVVSVAAVYGYAKMVDNRTAFKLRAKALPKKFLDSDDTLLQDCLKKLEGETWITCTAEFQAFLQLATTDHWIACKPDAALAAYRHLASETVSPLNVVLRLGDQSVDTPRQAHSVARTAMDLLAHDAETLDRFRQWKQQEDADAASVVAKDATPSETTVYLAALGCLVFLGFIIGNLSMPEFGWLMDKGSVAGLKDKAPVFFGHVLGQFQNMGPSIRRSLMGLGFGGLVGWGIFGLFARLQRDQAPAAFNNKLLLAGMAGLAAFFVVQPPVKSSAITAQICTAMQDGFGIAASEGPTARHAASNAYRSLCIEGKTGELSALPMAPSAQRVSESKSSDWDRVTQGVMPVRPSDIGRWRHQSGENAPIMQFAPSVSESTPGDAVRTAQEQPGPVQADNTPRIDRETIIRMDRELQDARRVSASLERPQAVLPVAPAPSPQMVVLEPVSAVQQAIAETQMQANLVEEQLRLKNLELENLRIQEAISSAISAAEALHRLALQQDPRS